MLHKLWSSAFIQPDSCCMASCARTETSCLNTNGQSRHTCNLYTDIFEWVSKVHQSFVLLDNHNLSVPRTKLFVFRQHKSLRISQIHSLHSKHILLGAATTKRPCKSNTDIRSGCTAQLLVYPMKQKDFHTSQKDWVGCKSLPYSSSRYWEFPAQPRLHH